MLKEDCFTIGENPVQDYYCFKNEVTGELVQIIRNKTENHWFGFYDDGAGRFFTIPISTSENEHEMLLRVCDWYNSGKPAPEYQECPTPTSKKVMKTILDAENLFGKISFAAGQRIQDYIDNPTEERWDDISSIIVSRKSLKTIWEAIMDIDSSFPRHGRRTDITGKVVEKWERIPDIVTVMNAIKTAMQE